MATTKIAESIKEEIARRIVEQAHPGYSVDAQGQWYVVNGAAVVHAQGNRAWNPWNDDDRVISVDELVNDSPAAQRENADFHAYETKGVSEEDALEAAIMFAMDYVPDSYEA